MARPRKSDVVRYPCGKPVDIESKAVYQLRVQYRLRDMALDGLGNANPTDQLAGSSLGRLRLKGRADNSDPSGISDVQYWAGERWARLCYRHAAIMGYSLGKIKSPSFSMVPGGISCVSEPSEDEVLEVRRKWSDCYSVLMETSKIYGLGVRDICYAICIENRPISGLSQADYGNLRVGLNALARVMT